MQRKPVNVWLALTVIGSIAYPALVYVSLPAVSPFLLAAFGLGLFAMRFWVMRRNASTVWLTALGLAILVLAVLSLVSPGLAAKSYPAMMSLAVAAVFGASLIWPPSLIERLARIKTPHLSTEGQLYTRRVTVVWTIFLLANAGISTATTLWGSPEQWVLWNGLISYILMGLLFVGEFILRQYVRRQI